MSPDAIITCSASVIAAGTSVVAILTASRNRTTDRERDVLSDAVALKQQTAILSERLENLKVQIPRDIHSAVESSRAALVEQLTNGLGERIIQPAVDQIADLKSVVLAALSKGNHHA